MGSIIELNDTLKLNHKTGFPEIIEIGKVYEFKLSGRRLYHLKPTRVFLVQEIDGKWNFIGHAMVLQQTIDAVKDETRGYFEVVSLYSYEYRLLVNQYEPPISKRLG